ncbi:hypothetical protein RRG08_065112 [Elysia crispata]|uniref:Uncharacterized protein n=1 Tax=Elysia crispata TaxID=231223 RepID=A0AAE0ZB02_9GAST|nr:hypothetical protein RRG08_065112 [Elysia crispata]
MTFIPWGTALILPSGGRVLGSSLYCELELPRMIGLGGHCPPLSGGVLSVPDRRGACIDSQPVTVSRLPRVSHSSTRKKTLARKTEEQYVAQRLGRTIIILLLGSNPSSAVCYFDGFCVNSLILG